MDKKTLIIIWVVAFISSIACLKWANAESIQEEFNGSVHNPKLVYGFKETKWTTWNKVLFTSYVATNVTDIATSQAAFDRGCVEGNPLMPTSTGGMIATKVIAGTLIYYVVEKWAVPKMGTDARNWVYGIGSVMFGAVSVSNNSCGR